jgi:hypothetical protein
MSKEIKIENGIVWDEYIRMKEELVRKLKNEAENQGEKKGIFWEIVGGGDDVTLGIASDGCWEGIAGTRQWVLGRNPSMIKLLSNYALASDDEEYLHLLKLSIARRGKADGLYKYLEKNKDDLMIGLIEEMRSAVFELDKEAQKHT